MYAWCVVRRDAGTGSPLVLARTFLSLFDFDASGGESSDPDSDGVLSHVEGMQVGPEAYRVELPAQTEIARFSGWSAALPPPAYAAVSELQRAGLWDPWVSSPVHVATRFGVGADNPVDS